MDLNSKPDKKQKGKNIPKEESDGWLDDKKDSAEDNYAFDKREVDGVDERIEKKRLRKEAKKKDKKERKEKRR